MSAPVRTAEVQDSIAIAGATLIDGNGGPPVPDSVVVIKGESIVAVGRRDSIELPAGSRRIEAAGKFMTPGFIDTNVCLSGVFIEQGPNGFAYEGTPLETSNYSNYDLTLEGAQMQLKFGVTTVRNSYGALIPLIKVRDAIARGEVTGPRLLVAGNIVGWGGPYTVSFEWIRESTISPAEEHFNDFIAQGTGEELLEMYPEELRVAINAYLDKGPDFIKYGGTTHIWYPIFICFSDRAQRILVEETHKRGLSIETHATSPEGLYMAIQAGIDLIQHPESLAERPMSDELVDEILARGITCSVIANQITGEEWRLHQQRMVDAEATAAKPKPERFGLRRLPPRPSSYGERRRDKQFGRTSVEMRRHNAIKLIKAGCYVTVGSDNWMYFAPSAGRVTGFEINVPDSRLCAEPGIGTLMGIEGLVELGMTPAQAIVAVTRNAARAARLEKSIGTIEKGKLADILLLDDDPIAHIANIRRQHLVMKGGAVIDTSALPTKPVYFKRTATDT
jgi:imidazolonepropionase-like amidohydrolase